VICLLRFESNCYLFIRSIIVICLLGVNEICLSGVTVIRPPLTFYALTTSGRTFSRVSPSLVARTGYSWAVLATELTCM